MTSHRLSLTWQLPLPQRVRNAVPGNKAFGHRLFLKISSTVSLQNFMFEFPVWQLSSTWSIFISNSSKNPTEMMVKKFKGEYVHKNRDKARKIIRGADKLRHF